VVGMFSLDYTNTSKQLAPLKSATLSNLEIILNRYRNKTSKLIGLALPRVSSK
jgi:hypothetical protein